LELPGGFMRQVAVYITKEVRKVERLHHDLLEFRPELEVREYLDRLARRLLEGHLNGDQAVTVQLSSWLPRLVGASDARIMTSALSIQETRLAIAREHGFPTWDDVAKDGFLRFEEGFEQAIQAIISGNLEHLEALLQEDPTLVHKRSPYGHRATLLHYVAANGVETHRQKVPRNAAHVARRLIRAGADVNATAMVYGKDSTALALLLSSSHPEDAGVREEVANVLREEGAIESH
jgi:hypothetical protein